MADSKITQLPLSPYALDKDLIVAVTGHLEDGAYPYNTRMPLSYIRRYVVRLNLMTSAESGIGTYYHSGLNVLTLQHTPVTGNLMRYDYADEFPHNQTISTTGLNTIRGNNLDIQFDQNSLAALAMTARDGAWEENFNRNQHLGEPYHSGIISVTGLNAYSGYPYGNLIRVDCSDDWPFSGIISQTGLNIIQGNMLDVQFIETSEAAAAMHGRDGPWNTGFNKNTHLGNKYHSGIISITGLNAYSGAPYGNLMRVDFDVNQWPYSGVLSTTGLNSIVGNNMDVVFHNHSEASVWMSGRDGAWQAFDPTDNLGNKYHSGIISTTGLNAYSGAPYGNLMRVDFDVDQWPYSGVISQTGLNSIAGNLVDVKFNATSEAAVWMHNRDGSWHSGFHKNNNLGNKYHSGIISITGLNAYSGHPYGNNIRVDFDVDKWPYSGVISQTGLNAVRGNLLDIQFAATSDAADGMHNRVGPWYNAFNTGTHLGNKYHSGILSITGVNAVTENLIVKEYQNQWPFTGIYYNTGLNARAGNHMEIMHAINTDADFNYPDIMGGRYLSGVISTTGLNLLPQTTGICIDNHISQFWPHKNILHTTGLNAHSGHPYGNNIRVDYDTKWPYSGIISQTGLNVIRGNLIDIAFTEDTAAATKMHSSNGAWNNGFSKTRDLGNKYHSGIISVTGLNIGDDGNRINYTIESDWPYKYNIDATGLNIVKGNEFSNALNGIAYNIEPDGHKQYDLFSLDKIKHYSSNQTMVVTSGSRTTKSFLDAGAFVSYCNIKRHKPSDSLNVLAELGIRLNDDCVKVTVPPVADQGSTNTLKETELASAVSTAVTIAGLTDATNTNYSLWDPWQLTIDNASNPVVLGITVSGNSVTLLDNQPIRFETSVDKVVANAGGSNALGNNPITFGTGEYLHEEYRGSTSNDYTADPFTLGANKTMTLKAVVTPSISSSIYNINGCVGIKYSLTNPKYIRQYRKHLGTATADADGFSIGDEVYRYHTTSALPADASWTINNTRYLKCESMEQAPTITFASQPSDQTADDGAATFTSEAKVNDFTEPHYQWQEAPASTTDFVDMAGKNSTTLSLTSMQYPADNGKRYRVKVTAYDGLTTSTSNYATLTTEPATLTVTSHPSDAPIPDDGSTSFSASASSNVGGTTIDKQWEVSTNGGASYSDIADATSTTLSLTGLSASDADNLYRCKFSSSGFSTVYSNAAKLWYIQISISSHPANLTIARGTGSFSVTASQTAGSPFTLYYRWERSTNGGGSFSYYSQGTSNTLNLTGMTYSSHDQNQWRVKVRLQGFSDDVETVSNAATLTVQEIDITSQPTANQINGKDMIITSYAQNYVPTSNGSVTLTVTAIARNSSSTLNYQWQEASSFGGTYSDLAGKTSTSLTITGLTQNSSHKFYKCLIDDDALSGSDSTGMERQTSSVARVTTSTFITDSSVSIDDNTTFASLERDGTSTVAETLFLQLCYDLTDGLGHTISVDAQADQSAQILVSGEISPAYTSNTLITHLEAVHPNNANSNVNLGVGTEFDAGDKINLNVLGNVNQFLCRLNVPLP